MEASKFRDYLALGGVLDFHDRQIPEGNPD